MSSLSSFYNPQHQFDMTRQNTSTITSLGASSVNGSVVTTSREHFYHNDHQANSLPPIIKIIKNAEDKNVYNEVKQQLIEGADPNVVESSMLFLMIENFDEFNC